MNIMQLKNIPLQHALNRHNQIVHVTKVSNGLSCQCSCPSCGAALVANQGEVRIKHFSHHADKQSDTHACSSAAETELHIRAKEIIDKSKQVLFPVTFTNSSERSLMNLSSVKVEAYKENRKPDLIVEVDGEEYLIEIAVTHFSDKLKKAEYRKRGISAFEIDLSNMDFEGENDIDVQLKKALFDSNKNIKMYWLSLNVLSSMGQQIKETEEAICQQVIKSSRNVRNTLDILEQQVRDATNQIERMSVQVKFSEDYQQLEDELTNKNKQLKKLDNVLYAKEKQVADEMHQLSDRSFQVHADIRDVEDELKEKKGELFQTSTLITTKLKELDEARSELRETQRATSNLLQREVFVGLKEAELQTTLKALRDRGCSYSDVTSITGLVSEIKFELTKSKDVLNSDIDALKNDIDAQEATLEASKCIFHNKVEDMEATISELKENIGDYHGQRDKAQAEAFKASRELKAVLNRLAQLRV